MSAPKGNQFWKLRSIHGREKLFSTPKLLWKEACKYFEWCDNNPLEEQKIFSYQGAIVRGEANKMRAYTLNGLCLFLGCSESYFRAFKSTAAARGNEDFVTVIEKIESTIYEQKFTGAAADLLNANIIARDLGLRDNQDITSGGEKLEPGQHQDLSNLTLEELKTLQALNAKAKRIDVKSNLNSHEG